MINNKIGVIGAGVMGSDVALDLACNGYMVILKDINREKLEMAEKTIRRNFRMTKLMKNEIKDLALSTVLERISFETFYDRFKECDFIIENVTEDWEIKKDVYKQIRDIIKDDTICAVNTSCISITSVGNLHRYPENIIGMHFMNPVPLKKMVEVIRGFHTSEETIKQSVNFLKTLDKKAVVVNDYPGFVSNRVSHLFMNEAIYLIHDGVATAEQVDIIFKEGYGHKMGPLETADLIGLDTVMNSLEILYQSYQDPKFRCCPLLRKMVDAGLLGKKSGRGFYQYG